MDPFSYLSVPISITLALGMTRLLAGVGEMLQARSRCRLYWVHAVWVVNLFLYLVVVWWIFYRWRNQQPLTFFRFIFVLISPAILYLASIVLFPPESSLDDFVNYKTQYYSNYRVFFILFAVSRRSISSIPC
jgi:zinc transporter ZupT